MRMFILIAWLLCIISANTNARSVSYFSPNDNPAKKLIELLDGAKKTIYAAVYMITDKTIAEALTRAKRDRKIDVQVITDKITVTSIFGKGNFLAEQGIKVWFFNPQPKTTPTENTPFYMAPAIMHHKFALIDNQLWNGSFNWTRAANQKNHENVVLTDDRELVNSFKQQFEQLKMICTPLEPKYTPMTSRIEYAPDFEDVSLLRIFCGNNV